MKLSHVDAAGRARMVDVGGKPVTARAAVAEGEVLAVDEEDADLAAGDGHELVPALLELALLGDHILHRP